MCGWDAYTALVQVFNPNPWYVGSDKNFLALNVLWDIYALVIYNTKFSAEGLKDIFPTYSVLEFHGGDKVLLRSHATDVCNLKYDAAYHVLWVMGRQLELNMRVVRPRRLMSKMSKYWD